MNDTKIKDVMEKITEQKEKIALQKEKISIAEGRRTANLEAIEEEKEKIKKLGYDPEEIDSVLSELKDEISTIDKEIDDILTELENFED